MKRNFLLLTILLFSCKKELNINDFSSSWDGYKPELRIEAVILPHDSTAIVRIDKSYLINDVALYDCRDNDYGNIPKDSCESIDNSIWHGQEGDVNGDCGDWNPFIHDIGSDGIAATDVNLDGDYDDFGDVAPDKDGTENNGIPDCDEPNVDNYSEILPSVHNSSCEVNIIKRDNNNTEQECDLIFSNSGGQFFNEIYSGERSSPIFNNVEIIQYGAYIPSSDCNKEFWVDFSSEYYFIADCSASDFPVIIRSNSPIKLSRPVVFFLPKDSLKIIECTDYDCLQAQSSISEYTSDSLLYFGRYSFGSNLNYASILPTLAYQAVQYMYDSENDEYVYYHGHPALATDMFNIVDSTVVMIERAVSEFYDGNGNGIWDDAETRTNNSSDCEYPEIYVTDANGGFCDNGNGIWDDEELYADDNQNDQWDEGEYFIDTADDLPDVDTYFYEIFTFSESYQKYYFNDQLFLDDVERTNLRDKNNNPVLGAFGSMTSEKIYFKIIDCTIHGPVDCENNNITKSVCDWQPNISLAPCIDYEGPICLPKGFTTEYCD